ncbi:MAG: hypothetical protein M5U28_27240 [Sandaracinaceae bacterium]|nr:hypothetical protein [Sandaracinaceae bacterium]
MSSADLKQVKEELVKAGVEIYRTRPPSEIQVAERVRLHIMDSGIRVRLDQSLTVVFTARTQRSDFPSVAPDQLFAKVRETVGHLAAERGYEEQGAHTVEVKDPMDEAKVLDTWHEITYAKPLESLEAALDEVRWALGVEKYITP